MQIVASLIMLLLGFVAGIYKSDNSTLMECLRSGHSRVSSSDIQCEVVQSDGSATGPKARIEKLAAENQNIKQNYERLVEQLSRSLSNPQPTQERGIVREIIREVPVQPKTSKQREVVPPVESAQEKDAGDEEKSPGKAEERS